MPPIVSSSRALARLLSSRHHARRLPATLPSTGSRSERVAQSRCSSTFARFSRPSFSQLINPGPSTRALHGGVRKRGFLGCGDGEEGSVLSKTYEERRVMGYSPEQLYSVVAAVDLYEDFVPWCQRLKIIRWNTDGSIDAELQICFKFLVERVIYRMWSWRNRSASSFKYLKEVMTFRNKLGSLIPSSTWKSCLSNRSAPLMHLQNAVCHMSSQLFVGGLSYTTNDHSLKAAFDSCGTVTEAKVIMDRQSDGRGGLAL